MNTSTFASPRTAQLLLTFLLTTAVVAQGPLAEAVSPENFADTFTPKTAGFAQDFGVKNVRGQLRLYGKAGFEVGQERDDRKARSTSAKFTCAAGAALDIRFLGEMREALALEVKVEKELLPKRDERSNAVTSREESAELAKASASKGLGKEVRLCGFTVELDSQANAKPKAPKDLLPGGVKTTIMVGPVPMLLAANASVGFDLGAEQFIEAAEAGKGARFGVEGMIGAYLNGWVIGGVGGGCRFASVCAGVKGDLRLMEVGTGLRIGVDTREGVFVDMSYKLMPATLKVLAIAYFEVGAGWLKVGRKFEHLLYQWSARAKTGTIPVFGS